MLRHLDSVAPETPIRDIVDRCRMCESHADTGARIIVKPAPERALPVYMVNEPACVPADQVVAAVTAPAVQTPPPPARYPQRWNFAGTSTVTRTDTGADTAIPDRHYGNGMPASGNAGSGIAAVAGSGSQGLDYDSVFFL